ncbi:cofactor-independent phosphoglycerate mutase [bacterium]|nr:cofactor-independent phosphoglycerate mutase [bacterium]
MKSLIILGDGMSDHPVTALGGKTPLQVAEKPHIDRIAREGVCGRFATIPPGQPNGSAVANLSVLGYDPAVCFSGRGTLEAASIGVDLAPDDVALRCNLMCIDDQGRIRNHSAGHIPTDESRVLIRDLQAELGGRGDQPIAFHTGVSFRHLMVLEGGWASDQVACAPPHDHVGDREADLLPRAKSDEAEATAARLREVHQAARALLAEHPVNRDRIGRGLDPANSIWVWSPGKRPTMQTFDQLHGKSGAVISAVDLIQGLGIYAGLEKIVVPGATGLHDTNYEGKAEHALDALERHDFVYVHVEATDEAGHERDLDLKIRCIEYLDRRLTRIILEGIEARGIEATVAVLPDHPTPVETGAHASDPVPVAIWRPGEAPDAVEVYDEDAVTGGALGLLRGDQFIRRVLGV